MWSFQRTVIRWARAIADSKHIDPAMVMPFKLQNFGSTGKPAGGADRALDGFGSLLA